VRLKFRLTFLSKFTLLTLGVAIAVAILMSQFLIEQHTKAVAADEGVNAAGQISAQLTEPMDRVEHLLDSGRRSGIDAVLWPVAAVALRVQYVTGLRIYLQTGRALFPSTAKPAPSAVAKTLTLGDLWSTAGAPGTSAAATMTQYFPFVSGRNTYVVAIDLSQAQMAGQTAGERVAVIQATAGGVAVIFIALVTLASGASRELERRRRETEGTFSKTLGLMAQIIDRRDPYTAGHSRRVADYSRLTASALALSDRDVDIVERAALLHDLGKVGIPDAILLKPARLDDGERSVMDRHPTIGADLLRGITSMEDVTPCVLHHHERIDGCGYPSGLRGDTIPLGARIVAVADAFDAMTTDRPYRRALTADAAVTELGRMAGTQFDARVVVAMVTLVQAGHIVPPAPLPLDEDLAPRFGPQPLSASV
jgi:putative nucleotidyltransferase with HDIG domain